MRIFLLILVLLLSTSVRADVYRSVDENGNTVYSDKPSPDAEKIQIDEVQTIEGDDVEPFVYTPPSRDKEGVSPYTQVQISSPQNNQTIRSNAGNVSVTLIVQPGLIPGHKVALYLDGSIVAEGGLQIELEDVERGTHSLAAAIKSPNGKELKRSAPVIFTVQRAAVGGGDASAPVSPTNPPKPQAPPVSPTNPPKPKAP
ncbi:MAG TPA: DUF4124 domain-containing protein [Gammaproteobacteria bacterium]|nr:DUF4124 domain-containing protein [Gammaproteobacteria bacterium]